MREELGAAPQDMFVAYYDEEGRSTFGSTRDKALGSALVGQALTEAGISRANMQDTREDLIQKFDIFTEQYEDVRGFFDQKGLVTSRYIMVSPESYKKLYPLLTFGFDAAESIGTYLSHLDLAMCAVIPNQPNATKKNIVHELAHSTGMSFGGKLIIDKRSDVAFENTPSVRNGSSVISTKDKSQEGSFMEEMWAEYVAGEFSVQAGMNVVCDGNIDGVADGTPFVVVPEDIEAPYIGGSMVLSKKYISMDGDIPFMGTCAFAAQAGDLIERVRPGFFDVVEESRTSVEGLRKVAQIIESMSPGLYTQLRRLPNSMDGFKLGYDKVAEAYSRTV